MDSLNASRSGFWPNGAILWLKGLSTQIIPAVPPTDCRLESAEQGLDLQD
jgi:hypothetical protein